MMNPNILPSLTMPLNPAHITEASDAAIMPVSDTVPMDINIEDHDAKAMAAVQEQLHVVMEAQAQDRKHQEFAEQYWQLLKADSWKTIVSDNNVAVEASSVTVMLVESRICHVSVHFLQWLLFQRLTCITAMQLGAGNADAGEVAGAIPWGRENSK